MPAVRLSCTDITSVLKDDTPGGGARTSRLRSALVIAQIAVAVVLLVGTALILRTMREAQRANAGFEPQHVTWVSFDMRGGGHDEPRGRILYSRLLDAVRADPDVIDASLAAWLPLTLFDWMSWKALGAPRRLIVRQYVQEGAWLAAIGTLVGVLFSLAFGRLMSTLLFGVASTDVASFAGATLVVVGSALLASIVPAWRAVARDPIAALRHQ